MLMKMYLLQTIKMNLLRTEKCERLLNLQAVPAVYFSRAKSDRPMPGNVNIPATLCPSGSSVPGDGDRREHREQRGAPCKG